MTEHAAWRRLLETVQWVRDSYDVEAVRPSLLTDQAIIEMIVALEEYERALAQPPTDAVG